MSSYFVNKLTRYQISSRLGPGQFKNKYLEWKNLLEKMAEKRKLATYTYHQETNFSFLAPKGA